MHNIKLYEQLLTCLLGTSHTNEGKQMDYCAPCFYTHIHDGHLWAYSSEDGGHMVALGDTEMRGYREWICIGLDHVARHRGYAKRQWLTDEIRNYRPRHKRA